MRRSTWRTRSGSFEAEEGSAGCCGGLSRLNVAAPLCYDINTCPVVSLRAAATGKPCCSPSAAQAALERQGQVMIVGLNVARGERGSSVEVAAVIVLIIISLVAVFSPQTAWYWEEGWQYRNVEPSDAALIAVRSGGVIGLIIGIVCLAFLL